MKYTVKFTTHFKKDYKLAKKRGLDISELEKVIEILADGQTLPDEFHDHPLMGNYHGCRECHITPDWLLIYKLFDNILVLELSRTGTHSDLFG
ncbi:MAG: type II toxin-antitoxin system YafQ family toxin [Victivallales bacterium]|nr:type II toxin-antitoxin system YafQ family toxin [Victivallales bacterium]MBR5025167.1 type II toxin-antitoxin system YafQ family toxin [Victivallales bacterium]